MTNSKRLIVGWLLATAIALTLSWTAVAQVRNRVIEPAVAIPTTAVIAPSTTTTQPLVIRLDDDSTTTSMVPGLSPATTSSTTAPSTTIAQPPPSGSATTSTTPPSTTTSTTVPGTATSTTTTTTTSTTTTTTTVPQQWESSSHTLVGGVVTISATPGMVDFVAAVPQPGFTTETRETGPDRVRIRFESEDHTSDFRAEWEDGELKVTLSETGNDED